MSYQPNQLEPKWQESWEATQPNVADNESSDTTYYCLDMFPYPSGSGLHVGHPEGYTATDIVSRYKRMNGFNVLHPMGWDAFGLPAENYAIKTGVHPAESTAKNVETFTRQIKSLGFSYDWQREINTSSPEYYKWTQWLFLELYNNGLAYRKTANVNWCNSCQTVLANEQVVDGNCERSKDPVIQKELEQWFFKITDYADQLLEDLDTIDWPEPIKLMQRNWIGRSEGVNYTCRVKGTDFEFEVYDSVPQTYMAQTFAVIAADHPKLLELIADMPNKDEIVECIDRIKAKKMDHSYDAEADMDGIFTGLYIEDPYGTGDLPLWVASFAIADYGSGVVNCSAHDERDFAFAKKFDIPLRPVMFPEDPEEAAKVKNLEYCYHHADDGVLAAPEQFVGRKWGEVREDVIAHIEESGMGKSAVQYKVRDWLISRQRYWGAPIPIVYDPEGNAHPVKAEHLPLELPTDVDYNPKGTSPIGSSEEYVKLAEELYGEGWRFEVDTMDTFVCSSWYYLRYCDPTNDAMFADPALLEKWLPVDMYVGGAEHAVMHLLYARFFHKALQDIGHIPKSVGREPFAALRNQGMILGEDHQKMSKSRGNVINPDDVVQEYGADTLRIYEMFMGPFEDVKPWNTESIKGSFRFLDKAFRLVNKVTDNTADKETLRHHHATVKKVTEDIEQFGFNTAISSMMIFVNHLTSLPTVPRASYEALVLLLSPFAPHMAQELWEQLGHTEPVASQPWPTYNEQYLQVDEVTIVVQVNGKVRDNIQVANGADEDTVRAAARESAKVQKYLEGNEVVKVIYVPNKLLNVVVK